MTGRTHDLAALALLSVVVLSQPMPTITLSTAITALLANQLGGIAPDIDQPTAPLWRNLPVGGIFGRFIGKMLGGHRFLTHSLLGMGLLGFLVYYFLHFLHPVLGSVNAGFVWWAFMIGMFSHLVMDSFSKEGVPWLLPIPIKFGFPPLRRLRITTGKFLEKAVVFPGLTALLLVYYFHHYQQLLDILRRHLV
jgi:inner membrane protein